MAVNRWGIAGVATAIEVNIPSTALPSAPVLLNALPDEQGHLVLRMQANTDGENVTKYHLYRMQVAAPVARELPVGALVSVSRTTSSVVELGRAAEAGEMQARGIGEGKFDLKQFQEVAVLPAAGKDAQGILTYLDAKVEPHVEYLYRVVAENADGRLSAPSRLLDALGKAREASKPGTITAKMETSGVRLTWAAMPDVLAYTVTRVQEGNTALSVRSGVLKEANYLDVSAQPGQTYVYRVQALDKAGVLSAPTEIRVSVPK